MRIKLFARFVLLAFAGATFGIFWFCNHGPRHHISMAAYERLESGMSLAEVKNILGGSPGDYGFGKGEIASIRFVLEKGERRVDPNAKKWLADSFAIIVRFDQEGHAVDWGTYSVYRPYDSTLDMLCQKLGMRKKKVRPPMWDDYF